MYARDGPTQQDGKNNASPRETAKPEEAAAVWVDIKALKPWDRNPRKNDKAVTKVAASMKRFGWGAPVLARLADGRLSPGTPASSPLSPLA